MRDHYTQPSQNITSPYTGIQITQLHDEIIHSVHEEVHAVVEDISKRLAVAGDEWLQSASKKPKYFEFTPIEMFAISERMKLAEPTANDETKADVTNYVEFLHNVRNLKVRGSHGTVGSSNIAWNKLPFNLHFCKNVLALWISNCNAKLISDLSNVRKTCRRLVIHFSMKKLMDFFLDTNDTVVIEDLYNWLDLEEADFSFNQLEDIDESVRLLCKVGKINFSHNHLVNIGCYLQDLTMISELDLSYNMLDDVKDWYMKLGNVKRLILAGNKIRSLQGLHKLYSLEFLDATDNLISTLEDVQPIGVLPCLERIILRGNPIRRIIEYRIKVLEHFGNRASEVFLDDRKPDQREMDTISVRIALKKAQAEKNEQARRIEMKVNERVKALSNDSEKFVARSI